MQSGRTNKTTSKYAKIHFHNPRVSLYEIHSIAKAVRLNNSVIFRSITGKGKGVWVFRLAALLIALSSTSVFAGFINDKNDWDLLTDAAKTGYVFGIFDLTTGISNGDNEQDLLNKKLYQCAVEKGMKDENFFELIEQGYSSRSTKKHPPFLYLIDGLQKLCNL
jgi:hypothetical protein